MVIHKENFVNPKNKEIYTQSVERLWKDVRSVKERIGRMKCSVKEVSSDSSEEDSEEVKYESSDDDEE